MEPQSYLWLHCEKHKKVSQARKPCEANLSLTPRLAWVYVALAHHFPSTAAHDQHVWSVLMHGLAPQLVHVPTGSPFASTTVTVPPPVVQHCLLASQSTASLSWSYTIHPRKEQTKTLQPPP